MTRPDYQTSLRELGDGTFVEIIAGKGEILMRHCDPKIGGCGKDKPIDEFHLTGNGRDQPKRWRRHICRDCDNSRHRPATANRAIRNRARHRAVARLAVEFAERFAELLGEETEYAEHEYHVLQAVGGYANPAEPVRLRPGARRADQHVTERIDVARCTRCATHHDRGHACPNCGLTQQEESND